MSAPHYRAQMRQSARLALQGDPALAAITLVSAWSQALDMDALPVIGLATPRETSAPAAHGTVECQTSLVVMLKRRGGDDLEDLLDVDSARIARCILAALRNRETGCILEETSCSLNGEADQRIGTLSMTFRLTHWYADPPPEE